MSAANAKASSSRVTNVQVPGDAPKIDKPAETSNAGAAQPGDKPAETPLEVSIDVLRAREKDWEAMRAQIRDEERAAARQELGQQIEAAASVVGKPAAAAQRSKSDYRTMRAADIDPDTLTAPVMTLDGYLCPPAPEAKK